VLVLGQLLHVFVLIIMRICVQPIMDIFSMNQTNEFNCYLYLGLL